MKAILKRLTVPCLVVLGAALPAAAQIHDLAFSTLAPYRGFDARFSRPAVRLGDGSYAVAWNEAFQQARLQWVRPDGSQLLPPGGLALGATFNNGVPAVAAHPGGGAFVAVPLQTASGSRIVVQSYDRNATPLWGAGVTAVDLPEAEVQVYPQLLTRPEGGVYVCFVRATSGDLVSGRLACQYLSAEGQPLWAGGRVAEADLGSRVNPPILLPAADGGVLVFWSRAISTNSVITDTPDLQNPIYVKGQRFNADGAPLWGEGGKQLHLTSWWDLTFSSLRIFAVPDGQGGAILVFPNWHVQTAAPLAEEVMAQRINGDGAPLWSTTLAAGTDYPTIDSLTATANGSAAAVVQRLLIPSRFQLVLYRLGPGGRPRPAQPVVLSVPNRDQQDGESQSSFDGGRLRILWSSRGVFESFHTEVRIAVFDATGRRLTAPDGPPFAAAVDTGGHYLSGFAFDAKRNQGLAVWNDYTSADGFMAPAGALFSGNVGVN